MNKVTYSNNDNELLYQIRNHDEEALEIMLKKYENLICSKIIKYHFPLKNKEDYLQEGRLVLVKAIETYREEYEKTFMRYFELLLNNRFNTLYHKNKKYHKHIVLVDQENLDVSKEIEQDSKVELNFNIGNFSELERDIYLFHFKENHSISETSEKFQISKKQVYNCISRIKMKLEKKIKKHI